MWFFGVVIVNGLCQPVIKLGLQRKIYFNVRIYLLIFTWDNLNGAWCIN
jgi:hypothetical protein